MIAQKIRQVGARRSSQANNGRRLNMVRFARCNALLSLALDASGKGCRYVAKGDDDDAVVKDMSEHLTSIHQVDPGIMKYNILASTRTHNS
jgi:predicted small metal-binding protein